MSELGTSFMTAFEEASGSSVTDFSSVIHFVAIIVVIVALMWTLIHFFSAEQREYDGFMERAVSRAVRIVIAFVIAIAVLTT